MIRQCLVLTLIIVASITLAQPASQKPVIPGPATKPAKSQADLEKWFGQTMSHATMAGSFNLKGSDKAPKDDKYTLGEVTKAQGEDWIFTSTIQFGGRNIAIPIQLPVKWAGDTPVITVENVGIPGLGTYNARVMIYGDEYVGVWSA